MAATTKLIVFNEVLRELAAAPIADLVTANTRLYELNAAFDHAVEWVLSKADWSFARRRAALTGVSDTSFQPYTYRYAKPSDFLRKCWIKVAAVDPFQIDHAEVAAVFYGYETTALIEYVSDHADNYNPANWPPHFTRSVVLYLAKVTAPRIARAGADDIGRFEAQFQSALSEAEAFETAFLTNAQIASNRLPVMRRAIEFLSQSLAGSVPVHSQADKLRWQMNLAWDHCVKYVLEQAAWNFAARRVILTGGGEAIPGDVDSDLIEGFSLAPAAAEVDSTLPAISEFDFGYLLPSDFLHKIWIKTDANNDYETPHQFLRDGIYTKVQPVVMEYVSLDDDSTNPANWTAGFVEVVAAYLALTVAPELVIEDNGKRAKVAPTQMRGSLDMIFRQKLGDAKLRDAIQQYPKRPPPGRFVQARQGGTSGFRRYN
jgi:hypothetical protein